MDFFKMWKDKQNEHLGKVQAYTPDTNFQPWLDKSFTPVLVGNYYWSGAYVFWFPDVSDLDNPTYGFQVKNNASWSFAGANYKTRSQEELQTAFIDAVNNGQTWEPYVDLSVYCYVIIQHGKCYKMGDANQITAEPEIKTVTVSALADGKQNEAYNQRVVFTTIQPDWDMSYIETYSLSGDGAAGLVIDKDGNISGVPTGYGAVTCTVSVTDTQGTNKTGSTVFTIQEATPVFNHLDTVTCSLTNTTATVGTAYSDNLIVTCSPVDDGSYHYVYSGGSNGLSISSSTGFISGTPTNAGNVTFTCTVTDSYNHVVSNSATVVISANAPVIDSASISPSTASATVGSSFSQIFTISATPSDAFDHATWNSLSGATGGLTLTKNGAQATVSGTPTTAGSVTLTGFAYDSYGNYKPATATITISEPAPAHVTKVTVSVSPSTGTHGVQGTWTATATCDQPDDGTYTYKWDFNGNANGLKGTASGNTYTMTGAPTSAMNMQPHAAVTDTYSTTPVSGYGTLTIS